MGWTVKEKGWEEQARDGREKGRTAGDRGVRNRRCALRKLYLGETGSIRVRKTRDVTENVWFIFTEDVLCIRSYAE